MIRSSEEYSAKKKASLGAKLNKPLVLNSGNEKVKEENERN